MKIFLRRVLVPVLAVAVWTACDAGTTGPDSGPSSLEVRAYVDADGSGTYTSADEAIEGATILLTGPGGSERSATTGAEGVATFGPLEPGSYALSFEGTVPQGATLAGALNPVVVASTSSQELESEFRFVNFPGSVEGVLFRDDNSSGVFDEGDTPAPGIPVAIYAGETADGAPVATTTTDSEGSWSFDGLRPGTYTVSFSPFPTMELAGGTEQTVTVDAEATTSSPVMFTGSLLSPISDARAAAEGGEEIVVAVEGVVEWKPGFSDEVFIRDETGAIQVYAGDFEGLDDLGLEVGDVVIVVGETQMRFGEPQITGVSALLPQGSVDAPEPIPTSAEALNAGAVQHQLVRVEGATVQQVDVLSFGNQFVTLTDAAGNEFGVYVDSRTGVEADVWTVGSTYNVTGIADYDSRDPFAHQIAVRGPADVVPAEAPLTIAEVKAMEDDVEVSVVGTVVAQPGFSDEVFIQDATGGLQIYARDADVRDRGLEPGDVIRVTGMTDTRFGERQLTSVTYLAKVASGEAPEPRLVTPAEIASGDLVHQLVTVEDATVLEVDDTFNNFGNQLVRLRAPNGDEFGLYVDSRTGVETSTWTVGNSYDVTGVINFDSRYGPFNYRIWVRGPGDVVAN